MVVCMKNLMIKQLNMGLLHALGSRKSPCKTISGAKKRASCVFPFVYKRKVYTQCTAVENGGLLWCATRVDARGETIRHEWGNCGVKCPSGEEISNQVEGMVH